MRTANRTPPAGAAAQRTLVSPRRLPARILAIAFVIDVSSPAISSCPPGLARSQLIHWFLTKRA
jgi:hypothetical protein